MRSQFLSALEWQATLPVEQPAKSFVAGTGWTPDDLRRDAIASLAPGAAPLEPLFPANWTALGNHRDWICRVHEPLH